MNNIKILISCHKQSITPDSNIMLPIEVGGVLRDKHIEGILRDDTRENISGKNKMYCELTAQYWAWKNLDADYYGFFHYRRYFNFSNKRYELNDWQNVDAVRLSRDSMEKFGISDGNVSELTGKYDIVLPDIKDVFEFPDKNKSVYEQYKNGNGLNVHDLDIVRDIIADRHADYLDDFDAVMSGSRTYLCNMYIMKKIFFMNYMEWLFDILFKFEEKADMSEYTVEGYRTPGHLAERLLTVYIHHIKQDESIRICHLQTVVFSDTDLRMTLAQAKRTKPAFEYDNVAIAVAANDYFVPYCGTFLLSAAEHFTGSRNYDIILLSQDISEENTRLLRRMLGKYPNVSIRVVDPSVLIDEYSFFVRGHFSKETYYRLVLPELLPSYDKILYLDSDMIALDDVAKIYDTDMDGYLIGACNDADTAGLYNGWEQDKKEYTDKILKLKEPYKYFQAGVLLMNLNEFRRRYTTEEILKFAASEEWQLLDQDILNKLCEGSVKYIDMSWNVMVDFAHIRMNGIIGLAPRWLNEMYHKARNEVRIIHYAGPQKPWFEPEMDMGITFWDYARQTPWYEIMLARLSERMVRVASDNRQVIRHEGIIRGGLGCIAEHGLGYTLAYIPKRLFGK